MFSESKKEFGNKPVVQVSPKAAAPSIIGPDLRIVGDVSSSGEVQVDGSIDGDIRTKVLVIGESATVKGEIVGDTVHVYGKVNGQIKARAVTLAKTRAVTLAKSAHVVGNILHVNLSVEEGAFLEGHCKRMGEGEFQVAGKSTW